MVRYVTQVRGRDGEIIPAEERFLPEDIRQEIGCYIVTKKQIFTALVNSIKNSALSLWFKRNNGRIAKETVRDNAVWLTTLRPLAYDVLDSLEETYKSMSTLDRRMEYTNFLTRQKLTVIQRQERDFLINHPDRFSETDPAVTKAKERRLRILNIIEVLDYLENWDFVTERRLHLYLKNTIP